ncbi:MAG: 5-methyltetrahydropteroyltriglutamate--homocysteine methyltransferase [Actinomycetota bacterium]|nr:5-methyltetrahydropteroyltriglutamate--homocysteine methyltransferase [Actinomycetota bacterium]
MSITTTVIGSYPKPPAEGETFTVRKTLHALEKGDVTVTDLHAAQNDLARQIIGEQEQAGIDIVTDGHARWDDILTPFARQWNGFEIGGLLRWFDNNVYYRRPVATSAIGWGGPASVDALKFAKSATDRKVKAVIPGPVTFARLSVDEHYGDHQSFVIAIAEVLAQEAFELEAAGADVIQIDEPALLDAPEDLALAKTAIQRITSEIKNTPTILATYFGDAKRLGTELFDLPVDGFGFDLVSGPENANLIGQVPQDRTVQVGVVDARNTKLEDVDKLATTIQQLAEQVGAERLSVAPSSGLEFLPREKAQAKLQRLAEAAKKVGE